MDSLTVCTHHQEGVQPDEGVPAQGIIAAAEQERFMGQRIQAGKKPLGRGAGSVYLGGMTSRDRLWELERQPLDF